MRFPLTPSYTIRSQIDDLIIRVTRPPAARRTYSDGRTSVEKSTPRLDSIIAAAPQKLHKQASKEIWEAKKHKNGEDSEVKALLAAATYHETSRQMIEDCA